VSRDSQQPLISLRRVAKSYGPRLVFARISFDVAPGEAWLVVGPNGAGKSTLLGVASGLLPPSAGEVFWEVEAGEAGYLGHKTFLYPRMSARANLRFWSGMYGLRPTEEEIMAVLGRVGLSRYAAEEAGRFSRGMAQRLALARIFLTRPKLVFLDEPSTGLDAASAAMLRREVARAKERGAALVWVSHNIEADLDLADQVCCLGKGGARYLGPARDFDPEMAGVGETAA
jgi:heme exporter protein A